MKEMVDTFVETIVRADRPIHNNISSYLSQVYDVLNKIPLAELEQVIQCIEDARWRMQAVFICGNGGSAATSIHFASDLSKGAQAVNKPPIKAKSLCENISLVTAWSNDVSFDNIFTESMNAWIRPGDVLIAISGSGKSQNVLNAVNKAKAIGVTTIGFVGFEGGDLKDMVDICITVPSNSMEQIEDVHLLLCHMITNCLREIPQEAIF